MKKDDELRENADAFLKREFIESPNDISHDELPRLLTSFAAECVRAERERADNLQQECDDVYERLSWILAACTIDRDAKNEIEGLLK